MLYFFYRFVHRIGWLIGAAVAKVTHEVRFLAWRARQSSTPEKTAWLYRCLVACALVGGEWWLLATLSSRPDTALTVGIAWLTLFILPKPTPRVPLCAARTLAVVATSLGAIRIGDWIADRYGNLSPWDGVFAFLWFIAFGSALLFWAFATLFRRPKVAAAAGTSSQGGVENVNARRWSNMPALRFTDVGGQTRAKEQIRLIAANRFGRNGSHASVVRNGILLHGPQGTGKNLLAEATAGEFRVNFYHVGCAELQRHYIGTTGEEIRRTFDHAVNHRPIVLFLDEIDAIGSKKQLQVAGADPGGAGREYNAIVTQLMQAIDRCRREGGLLLMAATNHFDGLEPTLIREGRFDLKLRLDLPDTADRKEILRAQLARRRWKEHDLTTLARRTPGWSPARLQALVDQATLLASEGVIHEKHLIVALESTGGHDRPGFEKVTWDDMVLPERTAEDLKSLLKLLDPGRAERLTLRAPTGLLLVGPPGTGKTMVAKLIASEAQRSFYAIGPSNVLSGAVGGSVQRMSAVFARARENAPSILFFDEMDGLFPHVHSAANQHDVQLVEQTLMEISNLRPENNVFLVGTTNDIERIDPRILRGGRFSEKIEIGVPDDAGYLKLLKRYLGRARLAPSLTAEVIVDRVRGISPADLEATIDAMKRIAMRRMPDEAEELPPLEVEDLEEAFGRIQPQF
ncbi:MAG: ATP-binding protein [Bryobacteraceae bacterium]|nr:ATP-binding protein [Bryobacteraceae bacterium]